MAVKTRLAVNTFPALGLLGGVNPLPCRDLARGLVTSVGERLAGVAARVSDKRPARGSDQAAISHEQEDPEAPGGY
jgi:hypothetical protein